MTVWIKMNRLTPLTLIGSRNSLRKNFTEIAEIGFLLFDNYDLFGRVIWRKLMFLFMWLMIRRKLWSQKFNREKPLAKRELAN